MKRDRLGTGWRTVRLGEIAVERTERVENPAESNFDRYVGSDDIDRFDWAVRRWRTTMEVTSAAKVFHPGDYLFVRRSLYASDFRERAARADFSGLCSGDILPLRERPGVVEPGFLAAVLNHPEIWKYVVKHATGSITRRIKWRDLAEYELDLPPVDEQRRAIDGFQRAVAAESAWLNALDSSRSLYRSLHEQLLARGLGHEESRVVGGVRYAKSWPIVSLGQIASVQRGKFSHRPRNLPEFFGGKYPFVQVGDIASSGGRLDGASQFLSDIGVQYSRSFPAGTVFISITGVVIGHTAVTTRELWTTDSVVGIQARSNVLPEFIEVVLRRLQPVLDGSLATNSTTQKNINLEILRPLQMAVPDISIQTKIVAALNEMQAAVRGIEFRVAQSRELLAQMARASFRRKGA